MAKTIINRLSKEVGLVLISSSLFLAGCRRPQDKDRKDDANCPGQSSGWHGSGGHWGTYPYMGRSGAGIGGAASGVAAGSARGGFGATGHAAGVGS